jgi:hypothetical protein
MTFFSFEIDWFDESCVAPTCRTRYPAHPSPVRPRAHRRFGAARPSSVRPHAQRRFGDGSFFCRRNAACAGGGPSCSAATRGAGTVRSAECLATRRLGTPWRTAHALLRPAMAAPFVFSAPTPSRATPSSSASATSAPPLEKMTWGEEKEKIT